MKKLLEMGKMREEWTKPFADLPSHINIFINPICPHFLATRQRLHHFNISLTSRYSYGLHYRCKLQIYLAYNLVPSYRRIPNMRWNEKSTRVLLASRIVFDLCWISYYHHGSSGFYHRLYGELVWVFYRYVKIIFFGLLVTCLWRSCLQI